MYILETELYFPSQRHIFLVQGDSPGREATNAVITTGKRKTSELKS